MPRKLQSASISFGLVTIPADLYTATSAESISLNQIPQPFGSRIKQPLFCPVCERVMERKFLACVGYTREDPAAGRINWPAMTPPEWAEADARAKAQLLASGKMDSFENEYIRKDDTRVPVLLAGSPSKKRKTIGAGGWSWT